MTFLLTLIQVRIHKMYVKAYYDNSASLIIRCLNYRTISSYIYMIISLLHAYIVTYSSSKGIYAINYLKKG